MPNLACHLERSAAIQPDLPGAVEDFPDYRIAHPPRRDAFTLIELSIVLVIVSLIIGGVLVGRDMIEAAKLRDMVSQKNEFEAAVNIFELTYNCLPGDCKTATRHWGAVGDGGNGHTCSIGNSTENQLGDGTETCNGNGNRIIAHDHVTVNESFRFWQHLTNAGFIDGNYVGIGTFGQAYASLRMDQDSTADSTQLPQPKISNKPFWGIGAFIASTATMHGATNTAMYKHSFYLAVPKDGVSLAYTNIGFLTCVEAQLFDQKYDDGMPASGQIEAMAHVAHIADGYCVTGATPGERVYTGATPTTPRYLDLIFHTNF